jgi:hypothetical protein
MCGKYQRRKRKFVTNGKGTLIINEKNAVKLEIMRMI